MISYVDKPPTIEPHSGGFIVTLKSGETETAFMLTRHALARFCGTGALRVKEADARCAVFEPSPFTKKGRR